MKIFADYSESEKSAAGTTLRRRLLSDFSYSMTACTRCSQAAFGGKATTIVIESMVLKSRAHPKLTRRSDLLSGPRQFMEHRPIESDRARA
jgi:hypothetical protein